MPVATRDGIFAVPGEYTYGETVEVKTAAEIKASVERQPQIMLTLGHPKITDENPLGEPRLEDFIGVANLEWNPAKQRADVSKASFYDEHWYKIPESLQRNIVNNGPISTSAGISDLQIVNGEQEGILYSHLAVLRDDQEGICPLGKCGLIRRESKNMSERRYEQRRELNEEPEAKEPISAVSDVDELKLQVASLTEQLAKMQELSIEKREPEVEPEPVVQEVKVEPPVIDEPAKIIPRGAPPPKHNWVEGEQGEIEIQPRTRKSR